MRGEGRSISLMLTWTRGQGDGGGEVTCLPTKTVPKW